ncbi:uncharacterized protein JCM6883_005435 [Sporobolomyces salmoneus]|uniref:uncharacterized protein n=1 Tax=Sporobolomyces salmoneus TaxID=183962 RepID=UPI00317EF37F
MAITLSSLESNGKDVFGLSTRAGREILDPLGTLVPKDYADHRSSIFYVLVAVKRKPSSYELHPVSSSELKLKRPRRAEHLPSESSSTGPTGISVSWVDQPLLASISPASGIQEIITQLASGLFRIPPLPIPAELRSTSELEPIPPVYVLDGLVKALHHSRYQDQALPMLANLIEQHRTGFRRTSGDEPEPLRYQVLREALKKESIDRLGRDVVSHRLQISSNGIGSPRFVVFAFYPPTPKSGGAARPYFYSKGNWTVNKFDKFHLTESTFGEDLYPIVTDIPKRSPTRKSPILEDPTLFLDGKDVGLGRAVYDLVTEFSLGHQAELVKSGCGTFVVGRVVQKVRTDALASDPSVTFIHGTSPITVPGVTRTYEDGSTISHETGSTNLEFGFYVVDDRLVSFDIFGDHTCVSAARRGCATAKNFRDAVVQDSQMEFINDLASGPPVHRYDKSTLTRLNLPGMNTRDPEEFAAEIRKDDPFASDSDIALLLDNYGYGCVIHSLMKKNTSSLSEAKSAFGRLGYQARIDAARKADPTMTEAQVRSGFGTHAMQSRVDLILAADSSMTEPQARSVVGSQMLQSRVDHILAADSSMTETQVRSAIGSRMVRCRDLKAISGKYYDEPDALFDPRSLQAIRQNGYHTAASRVAVGRAHSSISRLIGHALLEVLTAKFKAAGLVFPRTQSGILFSSIWRAMDLQPGCRCKNLQSFLLKHWDVKIVFNVDALTSSDPETSRILTARVKQCDWLMSEAWTRQGLNGKGSHELVFILAVIDSDMVEIQPIPRTSSCPSPAPRATISGGAPFQGRRSTPSTRTLPLSNHRNLDHSTSSSSTSPAPAPRATISGGAPFQGRRSTSTCVQRSTLD